VREVEDEGSSAEKNLLPRVKVHSGGSSRRTFFHEDQWKKFFRGIQQKNLVPHVKDEATLTRGRNVFHRTPRKNVLPQNPAEEPSFTSNQSFTRKNLLPCIPHRRRFFHGDTGKKVLPRDGLVACGRRF